MLTSGAPHSQLFPRKEGAGRSTYLCPCPLNDNFDKTIHNQARAAAEYVRPACLPTTHVEHGARCWIAGWGYTKYDPDGSPKGSALSRFLKEAAVNVFSNDYCKENSYLKLAKWVLFKNKNVI